VKFSQITCALSNTVFRVTHGKENLLLRLYGSTDHGLFDRQQEVEGASFVASKGFGPQVMNTFEDGRVEEWLYGRAPSHEEMRTAENIRKIASKLRSFHDRTGLNHNDLHHNNMLLTEKGDVEFLDFEYATSADPALDIANHFNEWMYPYTGDAPHLFQLRFYPQLCQQREFCEAYLGKSKGKGSLVDDFLKEVDRRRVDSHEFWVKWADSNPCEFNEKYGKARRELLESCMESESAHLVQVPRSISPPAVFQHAAHVAKTLALLKVPEPEPVHSAELC